MVNSLASILLPACQVATKAKEKSAEQTVFCWVLRPRSLEDLRCVLVLAFGVGLCHYKLSKVSTAYHDQAEEQGTETLKFSNAADLLAYLIKAIAKFTDQKALPTEMFQVLEFVS